MPPLGFGCSGQAAGRGSRQGRACRTWHHTQAYTSQLSLPDARRCRNNGHRLRGPPHSQTRHRKSVHEHQPGACIGRYIGLAVWAVPSCPGMSWPVLACLVLYGTIADSTCSGSVQNRDLANEIWLPSTAGLTGESQSRALHADSGALQAACWTYS
jgi:hypothetical protein